MNYLLYFLHVGNSLGCYSTSHQLQSICQRAFSIKQLVSASPLLRNRIGSLRHIQQSTTNKRFRPVNVSRHIFEAVCNICRALLQPPFCAAEAAIGVRHDWIARRHLHNFTYLHIIIIIISGTTATAIVLLSCCCLLLPPPPPPSPQRTSLAQVSEMCVSLGFCSAHFFAFSGAFVRASPSPGHSRSPLIFP